MNEYLERELGYAPQAGIERVRVAQALAQLPRIEASLGEGALSFSAVRELTRVATADTEHAWLGAVHGKNLRQIEAMVSGKKPGDRPEDPTRPELVNRIVRLELGPAAFAAFRQVQSAMADEHGGRLDDSALIETLCRRALEAGAGSERPAHQIAITVCESCHRGWQNGAGREIEVSAEVLDRARCDAERIGSLEAGQPARVTSTLTPRVRRQVLARDHHGCTVPGCRSARSLDVHHIQFRSDGGGNHLSNLVTLCSGHHGQLHAGLLIVRGEAPDTLEFTWREAPERHTGAKAGGGNRPRVPQAAESTTHADLTLHRHSSLHPRVVRRSSAVKLTLLPMLASAAVAAQPAASDDPLLHPPGATAPMLSPPGLTPTLDDCRNDPDDERCPPVVDDQAPATAYGVHAHGGFAGRHHCGFRGGFGHYLWASGG